MGIFILGGVVFIVAFCLFKISAFRKVKPDESWTKIALVGLTDYLILVSGTIGTGILFMTLYNAGH